MQPKQIMVYQDDNAHCTNWTRYGAVLSKKNDAHLSGVFIEPDQSGLKYFDDALVKTIKHCVDHENSPATLAKKKFEQIANELEVDAAFKVITEPAEVSLRREARFYNLIVTGQPDMDSRALQDEQSALSHLLIGGGRPVIIVPKNHQSEPNWKRVTIAWDGGRESARAFFDFLPFMNAEQSIDLVTVRSSNSSRPFEIARTGEVTQLLKSMGVNASHRILDGNEKRSGRQILDAAANTCSGLIVMGAYGHSRLRELALGSATRTVIRETSIPVFMSH